MNNDTWLVCLQTSYNCIKYYTSDGVLKYPLYYDFLKMMMERNIQYPSEFKKNIDTFKTIFINLQTMEWKIMDIEKSIDNSFEELYDLNYTPEKENSQESMITKGKNFIFGKKGREF